MNRALFRSLDWYLIGVVILLVVTGIVTIYSVTYVRGMTALAVGQAEYALLGIPVVLALAAFDYHRLRSWSLWLYAGTIILLIAVVFFGTSVFGARRWLEIGFFQLQPSEPMKVVLVLLGARVLSARYGELKFRELLFFLLLVLVPVGLVIKQPDLGTSSVLLFVTGALLVAGRLARSHWVFLMASIAVMLPLLFFNLKPYQVERIETFLSPSSDPYGAGYNVLQSLIAVGNGGMFGQGFGHGTQSQLQFLPVVHTDFIFAGIAESTGLMGSLFVIGLLTFLVVRTLFIARRAPDTFGMLLAIGIGALWAVQFIINIAMNVGLAPVTGIPLPFISHGGTALVINLAALGILESIAIRSRLLGKFVVRRT